MKLKTDNSLNIGELKKLISEAQREIQGGFLLEEPVDLEEVGVKKNKYYMKAVYLFGPAGAGKGFISKSFLGIPVKERTSSGIEPGTEKGFNKINPDDFIEDIFPAFGIPLKFANAQEGDDPGLEEFQQKVREQLQQYAKNEATMLILGAQPVLFDTTGENTKKMIGRIKTLGRLGYSIGVAQIFVPRDVSVQRDQDRERTVGHGRTAEINDRYAREVMQWRNYFKQLASEPNVQIFGEDVYPNVFQLDKETMTVGEPLPGITPEVLEALGTSQQKAQQLLDSMRDDAASFLNSPPTEMAAKFNKAQRKMIKMTGKGGGKHKGQILPDLELVFTEPFQKEYPEVASDPDIIEAASTLASLGGVEHFVTKGGMLPKDKGAKEDGVVLDKPLRQTDSPYMNMPSGNPVKRGQRFVSNPDNSKGEQGPKHPQGRTGTRTRVREAGLEENIRDIVKRVVLQMRKELGE